MVRVYQSNHNTIVIVGDSSPHRINPLVCRLMIQITMMVEKMDALYQAKGTIHGVKIGGYGDSHFEAIENAIGDLCVMCGGTGKVEVGEFDNWDTVDCLCQKDY